MPERSLALAARQGPLQRAILTGLLTLVFAVSAWEQSNALALGVNLPYFFILFFLLFSVGEPRTGSWAAPWLQASSWRVSLLPFLLAVSCLGYLQVSSIETPAYAGWLFPLLFIAPALYFHYLCAPRAQVGGRELIGVVLCLLPFAAGKLHLPAGLPFEGAAFGSVWLTASLIVVLYALVTLRALPGVGFIPHWNPRHLRDALLGWLLFVPLAVGIGLWTGFLQPRAPSAGEIGIVPLVATFLRGFFHTALPEELLFRGILQNLFEQFLHQRGNARTVLLIGGGLLLGLSVAAGYSLGGDTPWLPAVAAAVLLMVGYVIAARQHQRAPAFVALALISVLFGLAHYHAGSQVFIALAMLAGWVYGYVYLRTRNMFYAALTHTLVNSTPALLGLQMVR